jgi:hypothetical protein
MLTTIAGTGGERVDGMQKNGTSGAGPLMFVHCSAFMATRMPLGPTQGRAWIFPEGRTIPGR